MSIVNGLLKELEAGTLEEIYVNGIRSRGDLSGGSHRHRPSPWQSRGEMTLELQEFALCQGYRLDPLHPGAGGFLEEYKIRWHCVIPPASPEGPVFSLRRHLMHTLGLKDFGGRDLLNSFLIPALQKQLSVLICGETGSGKSSLLHSILREHAPDQRLLILEELAEIPLSGPLWSRLLTRASSASGQGAISHRELFLQSLRLRPDRIVYGEIRGEDITWFLQAVDSGHSGTMATVHARDRDSLLRRFPDLKSLSGKNSLCIVFMSRGSPPAIKGVENL